MLVLDFRRRIREHFVQALESFLVFWKLVATDEFAANVFQETPLSLA
jgi:hypothetical protein